MEAGAHVWCSDDDGDEAWMLAEVLKKGEDMIHLQRVSDPSMKFTRDAEIVDKETGFRKFKGVELANATLSAEEKAEGRDDDLITLPHLHEPALLHAVGERFVDGKIYTWTGPILIAVNPFQRLPLYTTVSHGSFHYEISVIHLIQDSKVKSIIVFHSNTDNACSLPNHRKF